MLGNIAKANVYQINYDGIDYRVVEPANNTSPKAYVVSCKNGKYSGDIVIPQTIYPYSIKRTCYVEGIDQYAFKDCSELKSVKILGGVKIIGHSAFENCTALTSVTLSSSVTSLDSYSFANCTSLSSIIIPNGVTNISGSVFSGCTGLTSIKIGSGVTNIYDDIFHGCENLISMSVNNDNIKFDSREDCNAIIETESNKLIFGCKTTVIPNSVTSLGEYAFRGCTGLTSITIPNSVASIDGNAFTGTPWFDNQPDGLVYAGKVAYKYKGTMPEDTSITLEEGILGIAGNAFNGCSGLISITIPGNVTNIGDLAFYNCTGLTSVTFPNSVTSIGGYAFYKCTGLTSVTIPNSVTSIGKFAFSGCTLNSVTINSNSIMSKDFTEYSLSNIFGNNVRTYIIGDDVTSIGYHAFYGCKKLYDVIIGNNVTSISEGAFEECNNLTSITFPDNLTMIGPDAFSGTAWYDNQPDGVVYVRKVAYSYKGSMPEGTSLILEEGTVSIAPSAFLGHSNLTSVIIPNSVTYIGQQAFKDCTGLTSILLPNSLTIIEPRLFSGCSCLNSVTIPNSVTNIGQSAFERCTSLTSVNMGNSVTSIGSGAFYYCSGLTSITIPNSVTSIGLGVFSDCPGLRSITIPNSVTEIGAWAFARCTGLGSIEIPNSVTSIDTGAFEGCTGLRSITIPNSVTSIGGDAFRDCDIYSANISYKTIDRWLINNMRNLRKLILGEGVETITDLSDYCPNLDSLEIHCTKIPDWFYRNVTIKDVVIGDEVTTIESNAFAYCTGINTISVGKNLTSVGEEAFIGCIRLDSLAINCNSVGQWFDGPSLLRSVFIGEETKIINDRAFADCDELTTVHIGNNVESIGNYAFWNCKKLEEVTWGNSLIRIGVSAFRNSAVKSIKLPSSMIDIDLQAFYGCDYIKEIYSQIEDPFQISINTFDDQAYNNATLYVPLGCVAKYKSLGSWNKFKKMKAWNISNIPGDVTGSRTVDVQDATLVVNYILGDESDEYDYSVADMNNDGEIDVFDVQAIVNVILSYDNMASTRRNRAYGAGLESVQLTADNNILLLAINNPERFTSFQFDVEVPEGMSLSDVTWTGTTDHSLQFSKTGENQYTVVALSMDSTPLPALSSGLVKLHLSDEADGEVILDNILFVTPKGEAVHFNSSKMDVITGIQEVNRMENVKVYDLSGRQLKTNPSQLPKGVYIINKKKVVVK